MGLWLRLFPREALPQPYSPTSDQLLLNSFLELEKTRLERRGDLEARRDELEVKKLEIELNHLEVKTRMQIETEKAREELRSIKRESGRRGMQKRRAMMRPGAQGCELCRDPNTRNVTVAMIEAHRTHEAGIVANARTMGHVGWNGPAAQAEPDPEQGN